MSTNLKLKYSIEKHSQQTTVIMNSVVTLKRKSQLFAQQIMVVVDVPKYHLRSSRLQNYSSY